MATPPVKPRNIGLKIISVVLAILLWLYVMNQGQISTRQSVLEADLNYINLSDGLTVDGPTPVSVRQPAPSATGTKDSAQLVQLKGKVQALVRPAG